jgi:hypothetical protein
MENHDFTPDTLKYVFTEAVRQMQITDESPHQARRAHARRESKAQRRKLTLNQSPRGTRS